MSRSSKIAAENALLSAFAGANEGCALEKLSESQLSNPGVVKSRDKERYPGWTLLHFSCRKGWIGAVKTLVKEYNCKPAKVKPNKEGQTPLFLACMYGHSMVVRYLVSECECNPDLSTNADRDGTTPLLAACMYGRTAVVQYLVNECKCDPMKKDKHGDNALHAALGNSHTQVFTFLLSTGKMDKALDEELDKHLVHSLHLQRAVSLRKNYSFNPAFQVCIVGNQFVGKSTLAKALECRLTDSSLRSSVSNFFKTVSGVQCQTAGIFPVNIQCPDAGQMIIYDFAGQHEYYSSHTAILENIISPQGVLFLLVIDVSDSEEEILRSLYYWNSFIDNLCNRSPQQPEVMVVGSHDDVANNSSRKLSDACVKLDVAVGTSLNENKVLIDCTQSVSRNLSKIADHIKESAQEFQKSVCVDSQASFIYGVIKQSHLSHEAVCKVKDIVQVTHSEENASLLAENILPSDLNDLSKYLITLSQHGQLLYLRNDHDINESWVILNNELLLSQVNGTIFAPENFVQHHDISSNTGVVSLSEIKKIFPHHNPQMIVSFLTHLEFCHHVEEADVLLGNRELLTTGQQSESYYFFPALVSAEKPVESCRSIEQSHSKCGWCLERTQEDQFFTTRFLHMLLLQLAFGFTLELDSKMSHPVVQRSCNVWQSGIHWQNNDGVEAIVEVVEQSTAVTIVIGCQKGGEAASVKLRSDLIRTVLEMKVKYSGAVEVRESLISPAELDSYPLKCLKDISKFGVNAIAQAVTEGKFFVTRKRGFEQELLPIRKLLLDEPYSCLSRSLLQKIFDKTYANRHINQMWQKEITQRLKTLRLNLKKRLRYGELRVSLDCYSVFCGRSPLVSDTVVSHA